MFNSVKSTFCITPEEATSKAERLKKMVESTMPGKTIEVVDIKESYTPGCFYIRWKIVEKKDVCRFDGGM